MSCVLLDKLLSRIACTRAGSTYSRVCVSMNLPFSKDTPSCISAILLPWSSKYLLMSWNSVNGGALNTAPPSAPPAASYALSASLSSQAATSPYFSGSLAYSALNAATLSEVALIPRSFSSIAKSVAILRTFCVACSGACITASRSLASCAPLSALYCLSASPIVLRLERASSRLDISLMFFSARALRPLTTCSASLIGAPA